MSKINSIYSQLAFWPASLQWYQPRPSPRTRNLRSGNIPLGGNQKYFLDVVIASVGLVLLMPIMLLVAAIIRLSTRGPVIFSQDRVGFNGEIFRCYKFCSMAPNGDDLLQQHFAAHPEAQAEWVERRKLKHDPRITWFGHIIRKSSIDELPQLYNVLRGEMSCVGPRPITLAELDRYGAYRGDYMAARPGITGIWQVSGRSSRSYRERVLLDRFYARRWSHALDLKITLKTFVSVLNFDDVS